MGAAEAREVARAVHVRRELQEIHDRRAERDRKRHIAGGTAQRPQRRNPEAGDQRQQGAAADCSDQRGAGGVDQGLGPPGAGADPGRGVGIEEKCKCDAAVEVEGTDRECGSDEDGGGYRDMREPDGPRAMSGQSRRSGVFHQKLRFVWIRN
jgi:hypothetical protein